MEVSATIGGYFNETEPVAGLLIMDRDWRIIFCNHRGGEMLNLSGDAVLHHHLQEYIESNLFAGDWQQEEKRFFCDLGSYSVCFIIIKLFAEEVKEIQGIPEYLAVILPKPKFSQSEVEAYTKRQSLKDLQEIIEASFDGILVTDAQGNVEMMNQGYVHNTGLTKEELLGHNILELVNPVWMKQSVVSIVQKKRESVSLQHTTKNGNSIIVTGTPIFDEEKNIKKIVVNSRDISEIYALSEELESAKKMEEYYMQKLRQQEDELVSGVVIANEEMQEVFRLAKKLGNFNTNVLITGESGVGKDEVAKFIHKSGLRSEKEFIAVNCGALPENLLESELFGYESGAFTGALRGGKKGLFEMANEGTLFLDEIAEISLNLQVKLLRVLGNREIIRLGGTKAIPLNVRIIAATNQNLPEMVKKGSFREDLYYRLNVIQIDIPPLRERKDEIPLLCLKFVNLYNQQYGENKKCTYPVISEFEKYSWPGNIRELKNVIENMFVLSDEDYLRVKDIPWRNKQLLDTLTDDTGLSLTAMVERVEKAFLQEAKSKFQTTRQMAAYLQIDQSTVVRKLKKYQL